MNFLTCNKRFLVKVFVFVFLVFLVVQCIGLAKRQVPQDIHTNSSTIGEKFGTDLTSLAELTQNSREIENGRLKDELASQDEDSDSAPQTGDSAPQTGDSEWVRLKDPDYMRSVEEELEERNKFVRRKCQELVTEGMVIKRRPTQFRHFPTLRIGNN